MLYYVHSYTFLLFIFTISSCKPTVSSSTPENEQTQTTTNETDTRTPKPNEDPIEMVGYELKKGKDINDIFHMFAQENYIRQFVTSSS